MAEDYLPKRKEPTCYFDATQLVHWDGKLTGIPRVMYELAVRFHGNDNVRFVSWVRQLKMYCEIDYQQSVVNRKGVVYLSSRDDSLSGGGEDSGNTSISKKSVAKRVANKAINSTKYIHRQFPDAIRDSLVVKKAKSYRAVSLVAGDSVFIPWGEWWDNAFLDMLAQAQSGGVKLSTFIHDVGPMVVPHLSGNSSSLAKYCAKIVPVCEEVFVNSKFTGKTLRGWLVDNGYNTPNISVVTLGDDFTSSKPKTPSDDNFLQASLKGGDYILTVGTVEIKKNHIFYYYVYKLAAEKGIDLPPLVIAGRRGWSADTNISIMQTDPALKDKFIFLFDTSDEELTWLYEHSLFTVFASMYEGWGLPLSESLYRGVPVISARSTSLMEIGEGMIDRFTQASTDECLELIQRMLDKNYLAGKRNQIKKYKPATWDKCYEDIAKALKSKEML